MILVLSGCNHTPRWVRAAATRRWASSALPRVAQSTTRSSAYLTSTPMPVDADRHASSRTWRAMLASNGEIGEPCGVPASVSDTTPPSNIPARSQLRSSFNICRSTTRRSTWPRRASWSMLSKHAFDIGVEHPVPAPVGLDPDRLDGVMGRTLRPETEAARGEVRLEDRLEDQLRGRPPPPVTDRRYPERPGLARLARLGDVHSPQRLRPVRLGPQLGGQHIEERSHSSDALCGDGVDRDAIDTGRAGIGGHVDPRPPQDVAAGDLVVERMEPACGVLLGTAIQHALEGSNRVHALGAADGPSRHVGTHQGSSLPSRAPMK